MKNKKTTLSKVTFEEHFIVEKARDLIGLNPGSKLGKIEKCKQSLAKCYFRGLVTSEDIDFVKFEKGYFFGKMNNVEAFNKTCPKHMRDEK